MKHSDYPTEKSESSATNSAPKPARDEVAKKACALYEKEERPRGPARQNWLAAKAEMLGHGSVKHKGHGDRHADAASDFRNRFWMSLTLPILVLSPTLQKLVRLREAITFPADVYVLYSLSSAVFWVGGWPFRKMPFDELKTYRPGMMILISVAIAEWLDCPIPPFGQIGEN